MASLFDLSCNNHATIDVTNTRKSSSQTLWYFFYSNTLPSKTQVYKKSNLKTVEF